MKFKKFCLAGILALMLFLVPIFAQAIVTYNCTSLTGGAGRSLDVISVGSLANGDRALVVDSNNRWYYFEFQSSATDAENVTTHPFRVRPDDYLSSGVWYEQAVSPFHMTSAVVVINEDGQDQDLRVEGVGTPNAFFVEGSDGNIGLGTDDPFDNLAGGTTDLSGTGAHLKSSGVERIIMEGNVPTFEMYDLGGGANDKGLRFLVDDGIGYWLSLNDNLTARINPIFIIDMGNGYIGIGAIPNQLLTVENSMSLKEIADANVDTAAYGQVWVHDTTPNELWFTDDAGTDTQISSHPMDAPSELYIHGPGIDWMGVKRQKLLGIIFWQTIDGKITEETFKDYNERRKDVPGHHDLVKLDYGEYVAKHKEDWKRQWIEDNTTEAETSYNEAIESYETELIQEVEESYIDAADKEKMRKVRIIEDYDVFYRVNNETGLIDEFKKPVYKKVKVNRFKLKEGCRLDEKTGKMYCAVVPTDVEAEEAADKDFDPGIPDWIQAKLNEAGEIKND